MARTPTLLLSFLLILGAQAQTYFYIDQIAVVPPNPTTSDNVSIQLIGNLSDGGAYIVSSEASVTGDQVSLTVVAASNGGISVLIPHTHTIQLGQLPAGTYTIVFSTYSFGILDFAPPPEHTFTVSGGGGDPCDGLELLSVQWQAFGDTMLVVHVQNTSTTLFDYPNFILFDEVGDTLAVELVNFFGIGPESWHYLRIVGGATVPAVPFAGRLELWTFFTTELACTWNTTFDLCPPAPCAELSPTVANVSGALVTGTFNWGVYDDSDIIASGQFTLTPFNQMADTTLCLPPGDYHVNVSPTDPGIIGILYYYVTAPGLQSTAIMPVTSSLPVLLPFTFYGPCIAGSQSIAAHAPPALLYAPTADGLHVWTGDNTPLGEVRLFDVQGRLLYTAQATADRLFLPVTRPGVYLLNAGDRRVKVVGGVD